MRKKDFHQIIEEMNPEGKEALRKKVDERLSFTTAIEQPQSKSVVSSFKKSYRIIASVSATLVVVCFAIILPILLNRDTSPTERYCYATECVETPVEYSIKEYSERNNLSLLYIDWYDVADELETLLYININDDNDVIYIQETIVNGETGSMAILYITDLYTKVDIFEEMGAICDNIDTIKNTAVNWIFQNNKAMAHFEYSNYKYFIELRYPMAENSVLELAESMIPNK